MAQFAVIGLGRFGARTCLELLNLGHAVIGVDSDAKAVDALADDLTHSAIADVTDERALKELNLADCDAVLVSIGEDLEASLMCVLHLKGIGVEEIWAKATSKAHHVILSKLGVKRIIHPEEEMGIRVAQALNYPMVREYISLGHNIYVVEVEVTEQVAGKKLSELLKKGQKDTSVNALLVKRRDEIHAPVPNDMLLEEKDTLVLSGNLKALKNLAPHLA